MSGAYALDDAAAAALWRVRHAPVEHIGLLYEQGGAIRATPTQGGRDETSAKGTFSIPAGSLRAIYHNHPPHEMAARPSRRKVGKDGERHVFSPGDISQAKHLGVPSYISAGDRLRRYDPRTRETTDVLAQIPIDEIASYLRAQLTKTLERTGGVP